MKSTLLVTFIFISSFTFSQTSKESLFKNDINTIVEELEFMYGYDQTLREYTIYKTFDKSETNRIEKLPDSLRIVEIETRNFESDSIKIMIFNNYINPMDALHTERLIAITEKYGFPSLARIKKYYKKEFADEEFNPLILFVHSPKKYREDLKELMFNEYKIGHINQCAYGYALWHFSGRKSFQPMLDNGFTMIEENGVQVLKSTCE